MFDKLDEILTTYESLEKKVSDPVFISDNNSFKNALKKMNEIEPVRNKYLEYKKVKEHLSEIVEMLESGELNSEDKELFLIEKQETKEKLDVLEKDLKILLTPKDPNDDKNVILEIRAGTGGEEAALFAADLFRMYVRFTERDNFKVEIINYAESTPGAVKEAILMIKGKGAYSRLKFESGVHRVQRVPDTESQGRVHTSAATVAVLPEADDAEIELDPNEIRVDVYHSSGHGGQSVNTTDSAVRLTHEPTGIVVTCQDEKSQIKNKDKAMKVLKSRLLEKKIEDLNKERSDARRGMVGSGDRSERIRTYNFPQNRVTDHRISLTLYKLDSFIDGDIDEMIDALAVKNSELFEKAK